MTRSTTTRDVSTAAARELLVDLVSIPSPSGEESAATARLAAFFESHGREVWIDEVGNVRAPGDDSLLLTSHVDTVVGEIPVRVEEMGTEDASAETTSSVLWGRGSVDATGPLCAMAVAAVRTGVSFVGVVGEEADSRGARHLVTARDEPAAVINGEPSGADGITLGYRGLCGGTYTASTASAHASRPEPNAIQAAMTWFDRVETRLESLAPADESDGADPSSTFERVTAKPVAIDGGPSDDGLAVESTVDVQFRVPPSTTVEDVRTAVEAVTDERGGEFAWTEAIPPVMASPRTPVARAFRAAIRDEGGEPRLLRKTGTSDANLFAAAWDCPVVTYGPGDSALDHAPDERLSLAEFDRAIAVLERVATSIAGEAENAEAATETNRQPTATPSPSTSDGENL
ncbi:[LysW]-lysine hydrolase [Halovivax gelatinilyticus]|uniref:[LysW]-lysine hydrolase n=1 Tax=Halovivax gelatinilyticus TaxID=2961597 RepID=UPI0020CA7F21|nr:[LysW]-lysine hydrolase [Halovivax gelatinilyticus]